MSAEDLAAIGKLVSRMKTAVERHPPETEGSVFVYFAEARLLFRFIEEYHS